MKKLTILAILFASSSFAQLQINQNEYFTASAITGATITENASLLTGAEIEYVGAIYARAGFQFATNNENATDIIGAIGLNLTSGYFSNVRYYAGARLGTTKRESTNGMAGAEIGIDFNIGESLFIGVRSMLDYKSDTEFYGEEDKGKFNAVVRIGFRF